MSVRSARGWKRRLRLVAILAIVAAVGWGWTHRSGGSTVAPGRSLPEGPKLEAGDLVIPADTARSMQLQTVPVSALTAPRQLRMTGQLMLDPNRLVHVTSRFGGEVVRIATAELSNAPVRVGQRVERGQLLAVLWSKEIGEKKSDLVDALSQLSLHQSIYKRLVALGSQAVSERSVEEMRQAYEADLIRVERFRRTLISWHLQESELEAVEQEARRIHNDAVQGPDPKNGDVVPSTPNPDWANTEIRSAISGVILERNLTVGDIVDANADLFKVADLSQLVVMASVYEEDVPDLLALPPAQRTWEIRLKFSDRDAPLTGAIDVIGNVIDPNQHTAIVQGMIDNASGNLRVGQFVETTINLPVAEDGQEVPLSAVIDDGARPKVLVATSDDLTHWRVQPVMVRRRTTEVAWVVPVGGTLAIGDQVVTTGGAELLDIWNELASAVAEPTPAGRSADDHVAK